MDSARDALPVIAAGDGTDAPMRLTGAPYSHVSDLTPEEAADELPSFCGEWPFPNSDLDLVLPEHNAEVHRARGCCRGGSDATGE